MRRLFSTFAQGWPGAGLLLMRVVACIALVDFGITRLQTDLSPGTAIMYGLTALAGILLLAGFWTPIAGVVVGLLDIWHVFTRQEDPWIPILLGTVGFMLAMVGPGAWSVDARLYGWKRIGIRTRKS
ncbi:MAG TPA: hypothetical protein VE178_00345 [Silvibacterium sp.]|nr:hypothetical protein [Silvibacterium sp.]